MNFQHKLQSNGKWNSRSFLEQMANIGSEVERTISWKKKGNDEYSEKAFEHSLELFDLTLNAKNLTPSQTKEVARAREMWVDFIKYDNEYNCTDKHWRDYFLQLLILYKMNSTS